MAGGVSELFRGMLSFTQLLETGNSGSCRGLIARVPAEVVLRFGQSPAPRGSPAVAQY